MVQTYTLEEGELLEVLSEPISAVAPLEGTLWTLVSYLNSEGDLASNSASICSVIIESRPETPITDRSNSSREIGWSLLQTFTSYRSYRP